MVWWSDGHFEETYEEAQASVERRQDKSYYLSSWADHLRSQNIFGPKNHVPDTRLSIQIAHPPLAPSIIISSKKSLRRLYKLNVPSLTIISFSFVVTAGLENRAFCWERKMAKKSFVLRPTPINRSTALPWRDTVSLGKVSNSVTIRGERKKSLEVSFSHPIACDHWWEFPGRLVTQICPETW